jgi:chemotaxis protein MotA
VLQKIILLIGVLFFIILSGNAIEGTSVMLNLKSALLVMAGTLLSAFIAFPMKTFRDLYKSLLAVFKQEETDNEPLVKELEKLALIWRRYGTLELEKAGNRVENVFLHKGIGLVVDGYNRYDIRNNMERDYELYFSRKESQVNVLNTLAKLSPVFGFVGTIIGLINVLNHVEDPAQIGKGMALALLTTLYGILFANFFFFPLSKKLSEHIKAEATVLNVILEGIMDIAEQKNSKSISHRLNSYLGVNRLSHMHKERDHITGERPTPQLRLQQLMTKAREHHGRAKLGRAKESA